MEIMEIKEIPLNKIAPNPKQARKTFKPEALNELTASISKYGLQNPIHLKSIGKDKYEIISGERRFRAFKLLNKKSIPAIIQKPKEDEALILSLIENVQREDLNPIETAFGFKAILEATGWSYSQLAQNIGKGKKYIVDHLALTRLTLELRKAIADGLEYTKAIEISKIEDDSMQKEAVQKAKAGLSIKQIREYQSVAKSVRRRTDSYQNTIEATKATTASLLGSRNQEPSNVVINNAVSSSDHDLPNTKRRLMFRIFGWRIVLEKDMNKT